MCRMPRLQLYTLVCGCFAYAIICLPRHIAFFLHLQSYLVLLSVFCTKWDLWFRNMEFFLSNASSVVDLGVSEVSNETPFQITKRTDHKTYMSIPVSMNDTAPRSLWPSSAEIIMAFNSLTSQTLYSIVMLVKQNVMKFEVFILGGQRNDHKGWWRGSRGRIEMEAG